MPFIFLLITRIIVSCKQNKMKGPQLSVGPNTKESVWKRMVEVSPLPLLYQRHQQLHRVVGQLRLWAPHRQIVNHLLQQVSHNPLGSLRVCAERCAQRYADLRRSSRETLRGGRRAGRKDAVGGAAPPARKASRPPAGTTWPSASGTTWCPSPFEDWEAPSSSLWSPWTRPPTSSARQTAACDRGGQEWNLSTTGGLQGNSWLIFWDFSSSKLSSCFSLSLSLSQ